MPLKLSIDIAICGTALSLASCATHTKETHDATGLKYHGSEDVAARSLSRAQSQTKSSFDQKVFTSAHAFSTGKDMYSVPKNIAEKAYKGSDTAYKTSAFAQAGKQSREGSVEYEGAKKKNSMADQTYATKDNAMGAKMSPDGTATPRDGSKVFKTGDYSVGAKAAKDSKRPVILEEKKPITEEQVQKMLMRQ